MWTLTYQGHKAAVVNEDRYFYEFESLKSARKSVKNATQIYVVYEGGNSTLVDLSPIVIQDIRVIPPKSYPI